MRIVTADQLTSLSKLRRATLVRVEVEDATSTLVDLTDFLGRDWVVKVERKWSIDDHGLSATVTLRREDFDVSLNWLRPSSKANENGTLIDLGRDIVISTAIDSMDATAPESSSWVEVFRGDIAKRNAGDGIITLLCRGQWGVIQDKYIEEQRNYPASPPGDLEDTIQEILDDFAPGTTLFFPDGTVGTPLPQGDATDPGAVIQSIDKQGKMGTFEAIVRLAQLIGWTVTYRFQNNTGQDELQLFEPSRTKIVPDFTFTKDLYLKDPDVGDSLENIRNVVEITFGRDQTTREPIQVSDAASIAQFGRRAMAIAEDASSQLDDQAEAERFAQAILDDLSTPLVEMQVTVPLFWPAEPGVDLYRFEADEKNFDADQDLGLVSISDVWAEGQGITTMVLRGKPSAGISRWLEMETRPAMAPEADHFEDIAPTGLVLQDFISSIVVNIDDPRVADPPIPDWALTRVYLVDEFDGGFPDFTPSAANLVSEGKAIRFEITDLLPNITYSVKVEFVDLSGNVSGITAFSQETTLRMAPFYENLDGQQDQLLRNNDFGQATLDINTIPPDQWFVPSQGEAGSWGAFVDTDEEQTYFTEASGDVTQGLRSVELSAISSIQSALIPYAGDDITHVRAQMRSAGSNTVTVQFGVNRFDINRSFLAGPNARSFLTSLTDGAFIDIPVFPFITSSSTRWIAAFVRTGGAFGSAFRLTVGRMAIQRGLSRQSRRRFGTQSITPAGTVVDFNLLTTVDSVGNSYSSGEETITYPGTYAFNVGMEMNNIHDLVATFQVDRGSGFVDELSNTQAQKVTLHVETTLDTGDIVRIEATPLVNSSLQPTTNTFYQSHQLDRAEI